MHLVPAELLIESKTAPWGRQRSQRALQDTILHQEGHLQASQMTPDAYVHNRTGPLLLAKSNPLVSTQYSPYLPAPGA